MNRTMQQPLAGLLVVAQKPPEGLPRRRLWNLVEELDSAIEMLVGYHVFRNVLAQCSAKPVQLTGVAIDAPPLRGR